MNYIDFLSTKELFNPPIGFRIEDLPSLSAALKPFQRAIVLWALRRERAALFEMTGLGKTLQQLTWARAICDATGGRVLALMPLAVAEQTCQEAERFGITGVVHARYGKYASGDIVATNYERLDHFNPDDYIGVVLDESGILKSHDGKTRAALIDAFSETPWKLCCTATPAPNDYVELGQHAEFLGAMTAAEMLATFFVHDGSIRAGENASSAGWRLKGHAVAAFWKWLSAWAVVIRSPSDLGFDSSEYDLPPLRFHDVIVADRRGIGIGGTLLPDEASSLSQRITARRETVEERCRAAANIVLREPEEPWLIWCHLNAEADLIERMLGRNAAQVRAADPIDLKVRRLLGFKQNDPLCLVSKPSICGHGMHYAHCARTIMVGLTDSFEELFQAVRRCWRFGQIRPVDAYLVASDREGQVVENLRRKELKFNQMLDAMAAEMRDLMREDVLRGRVASAPYEPRTVMEVPEWLTT